MTADPKFKIYTIRMLSAKNSKQILPVIHMTTDAADGSINLKDSDLQVSMCAY